MRRLLTFETFVVVVLIIGFLGFVFCVWHDLHGLDAETPKLVVAKEKIQRGGFLGTGGEALYLIAQDGTVCNAFEWEYVAAVPGKSIVKCGWR